MLYFYLFFSSFHIYFVTFSSASLPLLSYLHFSSTSLPFTFLPSLLVYQLTFSFLFSSTNLLCTFCFTFCIFFLIPIIVPSLVLTLTLLFPTYSCIFSPINSSTSFVHTPKHLSILFQHYRW